MTDTERLTAVTPYSRLAGSSRVRVHEWADRIPEIDSVIAGRSTGGRWLSRQNLHSMTDSFRSLARLDQQLPADHHRSLLVHREAVTLGRGRPESRLLTRARFGVYDFDDALFEDTGGGVRSLSPKRLIVERSAVAANRVIAANDHLADWASDHSAEVVVIPSCIEPSRYRTSPQERSLRPAIVWLGSPSTSVFLHQIAGALRGLAERHDFVLNAIGADPEVATIGSFVEVIPWTPHIEADLCDHGDIGIMPMPDTPYARGKSAYKLLQYAAAGVPSVASPVGATTAIAERIGALCATTNDEWFDALDLLLDDASQRSANGRRSRERVVQDYSYERWLGPFRAAVGLPEAA